MTMIERVAASIVVAQKRGLDRNGVARAAIEAMRDPDEAMCVAGCREDDILGELVDWRGPNTTTREVVAGVFNAMIDQALKDEA